MRATAMIFGTSWLLSCASAPGASTVTGASTHVGFATTADVARRTDPPPGGGPRCRVDASAASDVVATEAGAIRGTVDADVRVFKGVPYAAPPIGALRWRAPAPPPCWQGVRDATAFAASCLQVSPSGKRVGGDEDCLYLNLWAAREPRDLRPVFVYLHGGTFAQGSAETTDGAALSSRLGAIVVTASYRLGALGAFAPSDDGEANFALLDVQAVLSWVHANIRAFGGDPTRVTVMGEGAGATLALAASTSPLTHEDFTRVILDGATPALRPRADLVAASTAVAAKLSCRNEADVVACLRRQPAADVATAVPPVDERGFRWGPVAGPPSLPDAPLAVLRAGRHRHVPIVIGAGEADSSTGQWARHGEAAPDDEVTYVRTARARLGRTLAGGDVDAVLKLYPYGSFASGQQALVAMDTDRDITCPTRQAARALATAQREPVWRFLWTHTDSSGLDRQYGAGRGTELKYLFGFAPSLGFSPTSEERALADAFQGLIARFVATGDPNADRGEPAWPRYDPTSDPYFALDAVPGARSGVHSAACDLWDGIAAAHATP